MPSGNNCIHGHMVGEADLAAKRTAGLLTASDIWRFPLSETLGLRLDNDHGLAIHAVRNESPAAEIGSKAGDQLVALGGQALVSQADIQWVLHHTPIEAKLPIEFLRDGRPMTATFSRFNRSPRSPRFDTRSWFRRSHFLV